MKDKTSGMNDSEVTPISSFLFTNKAHKIGVISAFLIMPSLFNFLTESFYSFFQPNLNVINEIVVGNEFMREGYLVTLHKIKNFS